MMHARVMEPYRIQSVLFSVAKGDTFFVTQLPHTGPSPPRLGDAEQVL